MISIHFDKIKYNRGETAVITYTDASVPCRINMCVGPRGLKIIRSWEETKGTGTIHYAFPYDARIYTCELFHETGFRVARDIAELTALGEPPAKCRITAERGYYKRGEKVIFKYINAPVGTKISLTFAAPGAKFWPVSGSGTKEYILPADAKLGVYEYGLFNHDCGDVDDFTISWARVGFKSDPSGASIEVIKA